MKQLLQLLTAISIVLFLGGCGGPSPTPVDDNATRAVTIKTAAAQIERCEAVGLKPYIIWGNEWLTVRCDFLQKENQGKPGE